MMPAKPELLAPAGGMEALRAAVENGADAIYLGTRTFSARGYAANFSDEVLEAAIDYAHLRGVKTYVTVNTLLKDPEMGEALSLLSRLRELGTDAVIVQDLGLLSLARTCLPDLPLHASTQMTLHNSESVSFLKGLGVKRVVPARECSLEDLKLMKKNTQVELETFIHGALCICYSGQCLLSSLIGGRSGNRGYCAQPCRKKYRLLCNGKQIKTEGSYLLSPKDLRIAPALGALIGAGIDSFKIEGRMKRPEYVAGVTQIYRRLIDRYFKDPKGYFVSEEEEETLAQLFNREFTTGYFFGNPRGELMSRVNPHNRGVPVGTVLGYDSRLKRVRVKLSGLLSLGDGILVENAELRPEDKGKIVTSMYTESGPSYHAAEGKVVEIPFEARAPYGSTVYRTHDKRLMGSLMKATEAGTIRPKIPVSIIVSIIPGHPIKLEMKDADSNLVSLESEYVVEKAEKKPTSKAQIEKQLSKLGATLFEASFIDVKLEGEVFIPLGQLNDLRTKAVSQLEHLRVSRWKRVPLLKCQFLEPEPVRTGPEGPDMDEELPVSGSRSPLLSVSVYSEAGLEKALAGGADRIYFGAGLFRGQKRASDQTPDAVFANAVEKVRAFGRKIYFNTPRIVKDSEMGKVLEILSLAEKFGADGVLASNLGVFRLAKARHIPVIADSSLNVFNSQAFSLLLGEGAEAVVLSPELTFKEIKGIAAWGPVECIVHGRLELMESEHCVVGGILGGSKGRCTAPCRSGNFALVDEKKYEFPLVMDFQCRMHLLNSRALCLLEYIPKFFESEVFSLRVETLGMERPEDIEKITRTYRDAIDSYLKTGSLEKEGCEALGAGFTKGHYFRGVQ